MNTLLFDAGNSRLKWAMVRNGRLGTLQAAPVDDRAALRRWLSRTKNLDRVIGVSVAGATHDRALKAELLRAGAPAPGFMKSSDFAANVRNGYREAWRLGDDRWAGAIAAWHLAGCYRTVCAISVGTALTVDVVDNDGNHRGGMIAPGPELMLASLLGGTQGIARRAARTGAPARGRRTRPQAIAPLADNTREAIEGGCLMAATGLIDRAITQLTRELGQRPVLFITGGGAPTLLPLLKVASRHCPELVLRGVAILAGVPLRRGA